MNTGAADDLDHRFTKVFSSQGKVDLCLQEAFFITDVITAAGKFIGIDIFVFRQAVDRIGQLDLSLPLPGVCVSNRAKISGVRI